MNAETERKALAVLRKLAACPLYGCELSDVTGEHIFRRYTDEGFTDAERSRLGGSVMWILAPADVLAAREAVEALDAEPSAAEAMAGIKALVAACEATLSAMSAPPAKLDEPRTD